MVTSPRGLRAGAGHETTRRFLRTVFLPNATAFTVSLILFETIVAVASYR
jgi:hypothetical protein